MTTHTPSTNLWQCDGCGVTGTEAEVTAHVETVIRWPSGELKDPADVPCWGAMRVGGRAWEAYEFEDRHPMTDVANAVASAAVEAGVGL